MDLADYKSYLKILLIEEPSAVLSHLHDAVKRNSNTYDDLIILQANWSKFKRKEMTGQLTHEEEKFQEEAFWGQLEKIGRWSRNPSDHKIVGQGVYQYLLSSNYYGEKNFTVFTRVKFHNYQKHADKVLDNANAGIVLGWVANDDIKRYYSLLFTGEKILLEGVGLHGGNDYTDFVHLDHGIGYSIKDGQELDITLNVDRSKINLFIDGEFMYAVNKPEGLIGKVGLRPWRARLECSFFEVTEK